MKKNQKYTKVEMYLAIELWKESKKTKAEYCRQNKISGDTFKYWYNKYRKEKAIQEPVKTPSFIPVDITKPENTPSPRCLAGAELVLCPWFVTAMDR
jgi:hypothetical protein